MSLGQRDYEKSVGKGGRTFPGAWGESRSSNITSHKTVRARRLELTRRSSGPSPKGVSRDGRRLKPPMAFAAYAGMSAQDQDAIVAFLRTLPPLE